MDMSSIGAIDEFGTYLNVISGRKFLLAICERENPTTSPKVISNYTKLFGG